MTGYGRWRLIAAVFFAALTALASFWGLEVMRQGSGTTQTRTPPTTPDYYVDEFNFVRMSPAGQPRYTITGDKLVHFPIDNSSEVVHPVVKNFESNLPPMTVIADRARIEDDNSKVHLNGNVNADRPAAPGLQHFHLESDYLQLLPDDDILRTDRPVTIHLGDSVLHGTGMVANNATREFRLAGNVRGRYVAPPQ
ncbi:MAG: LPS export ABC transporter periplasmic protein LptC [Burkholderiaceae bacterium]